MEIYDYALVKNNLVINIVRWSGENDIDFGEGVLAVKLEDGYTIGIGYSYNDGKFSPPELTEKEKEQLKAEAIANNISKKETLINDATMSITVFQTKLLMGRKLTEAEMALLNGRMDYIDLLSAIDANTAEPIDWPALPA